MLCLEPFEDVGKSEDNKHIHDVLTKNSFEHKRVDSCQKLKILCLKIIHVEKFGFGFILRYLSQ